jgi:hypothetical protein
MARIEKDNVAVPVVIQMVAGDLRLRGRAGDRLIIDGDDARVEQIGEGQPYVVTGTGDARIAVPDKVKVSVQQVGGDARITDLGEDIDVQTVGGDLSMRNVQGIQVKAVGGDLRIKHADGNVTVEAVGSDATIREVDGGVWVAAVGSDLYVRNVEGSCVVERVGSDLVLSLDFAPGHEYRFSAGSDIFCRVRPDTNATFVLPPDTELAINVDTNAEEKDDGGQRTVTLGDGSATVHINGASTLNLVGEEEDYEDYMIDFGAQISEELEARLSTLEEKLGQHLEGLDERIQAKTVYITEKAEKIAERARQQAERAAERAQRQAERAMRSMDRQTKKKRRRMPGTFTMGTPASSPPPRPKEPVTEQERLLILQMVQENKISIEEAERLLAALDS